MNLKQTLFNHCQGVLNNRLKRIQTSISDLQNSLLSETKSTAGDKHETGRAMLQIEREKAGQQLANIQKQFEILNKINPKAKQNKIALGSIVLTSQANYFISIGIGEICNNSNTYYAISMASPVARLLMGKTVGDKFVLGHREITITKII